MPPEVVLPSEADKSVKALGDLMADHKPSEISKTYVDQQLDCIEYR